MYLQEIMKDRLTSRHCDPIYPTPVFVEGRTIELNSYILHKS